jgi:cell division septum initiation protein DivIVA
VVDDCDKMNQHKEENKALKKKVDKLNTTLAKFTKGSKIFKTILASKNVFSTTEV